MKYLIASLALSSLVGCAGMDKAMTGSNAMPDREQRIVMAAKFKFTDENKKAFIEGQPFIGMTTEQLEEMWANQPVRTQKKLTARGSEDTRLYKLRSGDWKTGIRTLFFKVRTVGGSVTEVQEVSESGFNLDLI